MCLVKVARIVVPLISMLPGGAFLCFCSFGGCFFCSLFNRLKYKGLQEAAG